jgi:Tfp pilus assembly protein PilO
MSTHPVSASRPGGLALWHIDAAGIALCAALGALWYFGGLQPLSAAAESREALQAQLSEQDAKLQDANNLRAAHRRTLSKLEEQIHSGQVTLQRLEQLNSRIATLTTLAQSHDLRVDEIRPGAPVVLSRYITVPIRLAGTGSYSDAARFVHALHSELRDLGVAGFELRAEPEAPDKTPTFAFSLLWYAAPGGAPAQAPQASRK